MRYNIYIGIAYNYISTSVIILCTWRATRFRTLRVRGINGEESERKSEKK